jgi:hypothetical protein
MMRSTAARRSTFLAVVLGSIGALLAGTASASAASTCGARTSAPVFAPWLDPGLYFAVANGGFESGTTSWSVHGGASVVAGNEPFYVRGASDSRSLSIPPGGSAETAPLCVGGTEPTMRFFATNTGSPLSTLVVDARVTTTLLGLKMETWLPVGVVLGTSQPWQPSLPMVFDLSANQLLGGTTTVAFRFTPVLADRAWQIDDVSVDPFKDR